MNSQMLFHCSDLRQVALTYPAIDNHAHPLLKAEYRDSLPFEGVVSEATDHALIDDSPATLASLRATRQLVHLLGLSKKATWEDVKAARRAIAYVDLCKQSMELTGIQCILLDDGLGPKEKTEGLEWHDQFTPLQSRRIVRIETEAERLLVEIFNAMEHDHLPVFKSRFIQHLTDLVQSPNSNVVGFKSIVCYRTGLNVSLTDSQERMESQLLTTFLLYRRNKTVRIEQKTILDWIVKAAIGVCEKAGIPIQFHTGFGDNDLDLTLASPAHLQPLIKAYPNVKFVLLHASYPFTREAGYLAAVYQNAYLDFGAIFPCVSGAGQRDVIRQVLELCPTNKILFSTDGRFWPESYYLAASQARNALNEVLKETVQRGELTETQAIEIVKAGLFTNANRLYGLGFSTPAM